MPWKLSVGVSRKVGQPGYGSVGASCGVEVGLDPSLMREAPGKFEARAREAHAACARAVDAELARLAAPPAPAVTRRGTPADAHGAGPTARPATTRQIRALGAIARSRGVDPDELLAGHGHGHGTGSLSASEASRLISGLRAARAGRPAAPLERGIP